MDLSYTTFSDRNWIDGKINEYSFSVEVFDVASTYGINKGRISRFNMINTKGTLVVYYDRHWNIKPTGKAKLIYLAVLNFLENFSTGNRFNKSYQVQISDTVNEFKYEKEKQ